MSMPQKSTLNNKIDTPIQDYGVCEHEKICRICLENDKPDLMIAPCACKGSSKWVHRFCLDQWRATNQDAVAFSKCTECLFDYHMEATRSRRNHIRYCLYVSHDIGFATLLVQLVIAMLGSFVWLADREHDALVPECQTTWCIVGIYYASGLLLLLVGVGLYGLFLLCTNNCSVKQSMEVMLEDPNNVTPLSATPAAPAVLPALPIVASMPLPNEMVDRSITMKDTPTNIIPPSYQRDARYRDNCGCCNNHGCNTNCVYACYCPGCQSNDCANCVCCNPCQDCVGSTDSNGGGLLIMITILAVVGIILAIIGLFVGVFIAVVVIQRILEKHLWLLQKRRLVHDFCVKDLSNVYDLEQTGHGDNVVVPSAPALPEKDVTYLKKLGLIE